MAQGSGLTARDDVGAQRGSLPPAPGFLASGLRIFDLSLGKTFRGPRGTGLNLTIDVLNAFNESSPNIIGFRQGDYGRVYSITTPRTYRGGVKILF